MDMKVILESNGKEDLIRVKGIVRLWTRTAKFDTSITIHPQENPMSTIEQLSQKSVSAPRASGLAIWMRQHPIVAYFTLAFAITWALHMPMVLGRQGLGIFPYEVPEALFAILFIVGAIAGPTLGAYLVTNALEGKEGRRKLFRRYFQWRVGLP
jgi:hypothetical protein